MPYVPTALQSKGRGGSYASIGERWESCDGFLRAPRWPLEHASKRSTVLHGPWPWDSQAHNKDPYGSNPVASYNPQQFPPPTRARRRHPEVQEHRLWTIIIVAW